MLGLDPWNSLTLKGIDQVSTTSICAVPLNEWVLITLHIQVMSNDNAYLRNLYMNSDPYLNANSQTHFRHNSRYSDSPEADTDIFKIGGFLGEIQKLKIFFKGSGFLTEGIL